MKIFYRTVILLALKRIDQKDASKTKGEDAVRLTRSGSLFNEIFFLQESHQTRTELCFFDRLCIY